MTGDVNISRSMFDIRPDLNAKVMLTNADITTLQVDAIVNAANESLLGGRGVDGAIHNAAGPELLHECRQLGGCRAGQAKITSGYELPAGYVIHTVGPRGEKEEDLRSCYNSCLKICLERKLRTVAFPCISTGVFGYPEENAAQVALATVRQWLENHSRDVDCIIFCAFTASAMSTYKKWMPRYFPIEVPTSTKKKDDLNMQGSSATARTRSQETRPPKQK